MRAKLTENGGLILEDLTIAELDILRKRTGQKLKVTDSVESRRLFAPLYLGNDVALLYLATDDELQLSFTGKGF